MAVVLLVKARKDSSRLAETLDLERHL